MSDDRPRPRYGEYATPEEQRARMGAGAPAAEHEPTAGAAEAPAASADAPPAETPDRRAADRADAGQPAAGGQRRGAASRPAAGAPAGGQRLWDRMLTFALLGVGVVSVLNLVGTLTSLRTVLNQGLPGAARMLGQGDPGTIPESAVLDIGGMVLAVLVVAAWVFTLWLSLRRLRSGRVTWWLPLVVGVGAVVVVLVGMGVLPLLDPAVAEVLMSSLQPR